MDNITEEKKKAKRDEFESMDKKISQSREALFHRGVEEGQAKAVEDFYSNKLDYEGFSLDKNFDELKDFFGLGYEISYLKQIADLQKANKKRTA